MTEEKREIMIAAADGHQGSAQDGTVSGLEALMRAAAEVRQGASGHPPVEKWNPPYCGDIGLEIRKDGVWYYRGSPIGRPAMVKLFASVLRKDDDGKTYLVTPVEKIDVKVEDAPFLAVEMAVSGHGKEQTLTFRTNVDDVVEVCGAHPLRFAEQQPTGGLKPYIHVRGRLEALATRAVYAELVTHAEPDENNDALGIWSGGIWWPLQPASVSGA
jgi:hypothetical protein